MKNWPRISAKNKWFANPFLLFLCYYLFSFVQKESRGGKRFISIPALELTRRHIGAIVEKVWWGENCLQHPFPQRLRWHSAGKTIFVTRILRTYWNMLGNLFPLIFFTAHCNFTVSNLWLSTNFPLHNLLPSFLQSKHKHRKLFVLTKKWYGVDKYMLMSFL